MRKYLLTGALIAAFVAPAMAATSTWYVAMDAKSKKCSVTSKKPDGTKMMMVGTDSFKSKKDASAAMKADKDCAAPTKM
jgi:hypothetical protein